jgi:hypothetical protein
MPKKLKEETETTETPSSEYSSGREYTRRGFDFNAPRTKEAAIVANSTALIQQWGKEGKSMDDVARELNLDYWKFVRVLELYHYKSYFKPPKPENEVNVPPNISKNCKDVLMNLDIVGEMANQKKSDAEIGAYFGVKQGTFYKMKKARRELRECLEVARSHTQSQYRALMDAREMSQEQVAIAQNRAKQALVDVATGFTKEKIEYKFKPMTDPLGNEVVDKTGQIQYEKVPDRAVEEYVPPDTQAAIFVANGFRKEPDTVVINNQFAGMSDDELKAMLKDLTIQNMQSANPELPFADESMADMDDEDGILEDNEPSE